MNWNKVTERLPESIPTAFDENGDIDTEKPYLGIFITFEETDVDEDDLPLINMDIVYYYGNNHWKNNKWKKVHVKYWLEIPPVE